MRSEYTVTVLVQKKKEKKPEVTQIANKYLQRCSISLAIREMQIKCIYTLDGHKLRHLTISKNVECGSMKNLVHVHW